MVFLFKTIEILTNEKDLVFMWDSNPFERMFGSTTVDKHAHAVNASLWFFYTQV